MIHWLIKENKKIKTNYTYCLQSVLLLDEGVRPNEGMNGRMERWMEEWMDG